MLLVFPVNSKEKGDGKTDNGQNSLVTLRFEAGATIKLSLNDKKIADFYITQF